MPEISFSVLTLIHTEYRLPATVGPVQPIPECPNHNEVAASGVRLSTAPLPKKRGDVAAHQRFDAGCA